MRAVYRICIFQTIFVIALQLSGCTPITPKLSGPQFEFKENRNHQLAQIYIYRLVSPPTMKSADIFINGEKYFELFGGGYGRVFLAYGETNLETHWDWDTGVENRSVRIMTSPGKSYFVKLHTESFGFVFNSTLKVVPELIALYELEGLREITILANKTK